MEPTINDEAKSKMASTKTWALARVEGLVNERDVVNGQPAGQSIHVTRRGDTQAVGVHVAAKSHYGWPTFTPVPDDVLLPLAACNTRNPLPITSPTYPFPQPSWLAILGSAYDCTEPTVIANIVLNRWQRVSAVSTRYSLGKGVTAIESE